MMPNNKTFAAFFFATIVAAGGTAWAADQTNTADQANTKLASDQAHVKTDFGKLSADGARGYQDLMLTRLAIYDGRTDDAKKFVTEANAALTRANS